MNSTPDNSFGPHLKGSFDFTLLFEQSILSIGPSAILLVASAIRIAALVRRSPVSRASTILWIKLTAIFVLLGLQLANLVLWSLSITPHTKVSLAASALSLADTVTMGLLLYAEHCHSRSPSILLSIYLSITILLDVAIVRSLFLRVIDSGAVGAVSVAVVAVKLIILVLEEIPKRGFVSPVATSKEVASGLWNRSVFWWLNTTFRQGFKSFLLIDDLSSLDHKLDSHYLASRLGRRWASVDKNGKYCLSSATFAAFQSVFWAGVIPRLCFTGFSFAQPFLLNTIVATLGTSSHEDSHGVVGGLIGATALIYIGIAISRCHYTHHTYRLITSVRGGLVALIFTRSIDLDAYTAKASAAVTLMSTDIDGLAGGLQKIHDIWASFIELGLGIYLLQRQIGSACFLVLIPAVSAEGMGPARMAWNLKVQKRVSTTSSALDQIKGIKMMGLSHRISTLVQSLRVSELNSSKAFRMFIVWITMIANLFDQLTPILIIAAAVFWTKARENLSVAEAFTTLSIVTLVSGPLVNIIAAYPTFVAGLACLKRIQEFLLSKELVDYRSGHNLIQGFSSPRYSSSRSRINNIDFELEGLSKKSADARPMVEFNDSSISLKSGSDAVLQSVNLSILRSSLTMIVGPVGSGKSALLKAILGEAHLLSGSVQLNGGRIAYCDQAAWLRLGSIRENIVGPNLFEETWYREVLSACALNEDLAQLEDHDHSLVGSAGLALSGGQKQRVALARAVYARASLVLLDDVFSALDSNTSQVVFSRLFGDTGILKRGDTTILLTTHAVEYLPWADSIIVLNQGKVLHYASIEDLRSSETYSEVYKSQYNSPASFAQGGAREELAVQQPQAKVPGPVVLAHDLSRKTGDLSLYKFYLDSVGPMLFVIWLIFAAGYIFSGKIPQIWLRIWTENGTSNHSAAYFGGYLGFGLLCTLLSGLCVFFFMIIVVPKSAQQLHWLLLNKVLKAPLSFFSTTDSSSTLNRFSQDMTLVDQVLPMAAFTTTFDVYNVIAGTALVASGATYAAAIIPFCVLAIWIIQKFYLRTSRQMRHLDLEAKSPLYRLFTETAAGVVTIRAFGWRSHFIEEHLQQLDRSQKPYYMMYCIQRWLNVVLDLLVAAIAIVLVGFALGVSNTATQGSIGLALLNVMEFNTSLSMLITSWTSLETSLGAIARLKSFLADTPAEELKNEDETLPEDWPRAGSIQLKDVTAKYNITGASSLPAIRNITLDIEPGQTVSIIGRTSSGKSSLILTLLRLLEVEAGQIIVDDIDISRVSREELRNSIITIPQDPVEIPGSVRYNLTSFTSSSQGSEEAEQAMKSILTRVELWEMFKSRGGLDAALEDAGLSGGQKQLFSLARSMFSSWLRKNKSGGIVLLDEPTSSVDEVTAEKMRRILKEEFRRYTIVTVTHRDLAGEADIWVRMAGGEIVEVIKNRREKVD